MADTQNNDSPDQPTRRAKVTDFPEVRGKTVNFVEVIDATEGFGITIRFHDDSALYFEVESRAVLTPVLSQWEKGEETPVRRWQPIQRTL